MQRRKLAAVVISVVLILTLVPVFGARAFSAGGNTYRESMHPEVMRAQDFTGTKPTPTPQVQLNPGAPPKQEGDMNSIPGNRVVALKADPSTSDLHLAPPEQVRLGMTAAATINVVYVAAGGQNHLGDTCLAFPDEAKAAFNAAANIWATIFSSTVPIEIEACWTTFADPTILGHAGPLSYHRNFTNAPIANTWYAAALANALAGVDLYPGVSDMSIAYSSSYASVFYYGTDGFTPVNRYDFESVVLHEIAHGLGFSGSMDVIAGIGSWGNDDAADVYDRFTQDGAGVSLINTAAYPNPSAALGSALTSTNLYFSAPLANAANGGQRVKLYAPSTWESGSSYAHLDEIFNGTENALMTHSISKGESLHTPGNVGNAILRDLGWQSSGVPTPVPSATPTTPAASFSVSGRVTDENGHGIADVFFSYGQGTVTSSDGDGYYTIAGLVAGTYSITPAKSGYNFTPSFRNITIVASDLSGQDFSGVYVPPVTYTVSGKITNAEANPISDVSLSLGGSSVAMTDASGNYSITGLSSGVYTVTPSKLGYTFSPASRAVIITSSDVNGQNFSAASIPTPTFSISGKVKTSQGSAVSGVVISDGAGHSAVTDASGNYGIGGLAAGTYVLVPSKNGYTFLPQSLSVNIIDGNISGQDFVAKALPSGSYSLSGIVTTTGGTPISGVLVSDDIGYSAMTDSNGSYTISGLPAGNFTLGAYKAGYSFAASFENPVVITNANVTNKNFNGLSAPTGNFKISGAISDANGAPLPGVTVSDEKGLYKTVSDGNGNYSLNNLPEGYYVFKAERGSEVFAPAWRTVKISPDAVSQNFTRLEQKIVVNSTADQSDENPGDGKCASVESTCTLRAAIEEANARAKGDIIELPAGTYNLTLGQTNDLSGTLHEADLSGNLVITDTLVIQGDGAASTIIDAKATHSVIEMKQAVSEISVEFNGVTLQNGNGAGVIAQSGDGFLALEGSVVRRNRAPGIWTDGIDVTLDASVLTENSAVDMIGGADVNHGMFTIIESMVINNDGDGGGIHAASGLLMLNSTVSENRGVTQFGGVMVAGGGAIVNSTISNNRGNEGGGIWTMGNLALYNCTVVQNEAVGTGGGDYNSGLGGGLYVYPGSNDISIRNSLLAENKSHNGAADCFGTVTSFGYNLVGDRSGCTFCDAKGDQFGLDAGIDRLEDNGGTTLTFALAWGSWAMDAGNPSGCVDQNGMILNADQRGATRPMDGKNSGSAVCDTGAFEYQPVSMPYEISGLVADEFGVPIPNATISLENGFQTITDKDGLYIIKNLGAGVYHLIARRSGYLLSPPMREVKLPPSRTKQNFVGLRSGNNDGIYTISGRVFDTSENPVAGVYVSLESGESALSDSQGNYFIRGVAAGVHTVTPMLDDYSFKPLKLTVNVGSDVTDKNFIGEKK